jgi:hypothetical protein
MKNRVKITAVIIYIFDDGELYFTVGNVTDSGLGQMSKVIVIQDTDDGILVAFEDDSFRHFSSTIPSETRGILIE